MNLLPLSSTLLITKPNYVSGKVAKETLQCSDNTLRRWANEGKIDFTRFSEKGKRFYNVTSLLTGSNSSSKINDKKRTICYCRVSSKDQKEDLSRQVEFMRQTYPSSVIISDIGSGTNWKRKGLQSVIRQVKNNEVEQVIVCYEDRLCRYAYELLEYFFKLFETKILVLNSRKEIKDDSELAGDILSLIYLTSCKKMDKRGCRNSEPNSS